MQVSACGIIQLEVVIALFRFNERDIFMDGSIIDTTKDSSIRDDLTLAEEAASGSMEAFETLFEEHKKFVYFVAFSVLRDYDLALDATQEVFLKVYRSISRFKQRSKFRTWIYRIAINHCINVQRARAKNRSDISLDIVPESKKSNPANPRTSFENEEMKETIDAAIQLLPEKQKIIFILRNFNDMPFEEIAEMVNRSLGATKASYFHAVRRLREILSAEGIGS